MLKLKVYPEEELEMSAEFIQALAGFFANSHGQYLKCAYAETLIHLLHPVIETATAEVNHPMWSKAIAIILQRALAMLTKPRYWPVGFSLFIVTLGVSPREVFMQHWQTCIDNIQARFKVSLVFCQVSADDRTGPSARLPWAHSYECSGYTSTDVPNRPPRCANDWTL
jgi:hypothetical protein